MHKHTPTNKTQTHPRFLHPHTLALPPFSTQTNLLYTSPPTTAPWYANRNALRVDGLVDPDGGLDWFESAIVRPDRVLGDLVGAMYPELKVGGGRGYGYGWVVQLLLPEGCSCHLGVMFACAVYVPCGREYIWCGWGGVG